MPTRLPPAIQTSLAGYWSYSQPGMSVELLSHLLGSTVSPETVRSWLELVRHIPTNMLRPTDPPAQHWHKLLARHCDRQVGQYALNWRVEHHLQGLQGPEAAAALMDFAYLYERLQSLGSQQARRIWRETRQALTLLEESPVREALVCWEEFWRGRQFVIDSSAEPFRAELLFLSLADGYAEGSAVSGAAEEWLQRKGPEQPWLRHRFRPPVAYHEPMIIEMPKEDAPSQKRSSNSDWVHCILLAPAGQRAVTLTNYGSIRLWDLETGDSLGRLQGPNSSNRGIALSSDGQRLAVTHHRGGVDIWDLNSLTIVQQLPAVFQGRSMAISGPRLYGCGYQDTLKMQIWDLERPWNLGFLPVPPHRVDQLVASADGRRLTAILEGRVSGWTLDGHRLLAYHPNPKRPWGWLWADGRVKVARSGQQPVQLSSSRTTLAESLEEVEEWCDDGHYAVLQVKGEWHCWDLLEANLLASWAPAGEGAQLEARFVRTGAVSVATLEDGSQAVSGGADGTVRRWDLREGICTEQWQAHDSAVTWLAYTNQGGVISGDEHCFRLWNQAHECLADLQRPPQLNFLEISPCGRFALGTQSGGGSLRDLELGRSLGRLKYPRATPSGSAFTPDSQKVVVCTQEGQHFHSAAVRLWQPGVETPLARFRVPLPNNALATDGKRLLVSSKDSRVRIWELDSLVAPGHDATILCLDTDGRRLVTGSVDKTARVWDLSTGHCEQILPTGDRWVERVRIHGDYVQTVTDQGSLLWDLERAGSTAQPLFPERLRADGRALSRLSDSECVLWNPRAGQERLVLGPHLPKITAFEFSWDGGQVLTATELGGLKVWDAASGQCLTSWQTPAGEIDQIRCHDEQMLLLHGADGQQWTWDCLQGTGSRVAGQALGEKRHSLTLESHRLRVIDPRTQQCLAEWPGLAGSEQALMHSDTELVAAQTGGELLFLQLMPPGPVGARPPAPAAAVGKARRALAQPGKLQHTPLHRLQPYQRVLLVGTGGRSDMLAALPLYEYLRAQNKEVSLAGLITGRKMSPRKRFAEVEPSRRQGARFEQVLADHVQAPLLCFAGGGTLQRLEAFRDLIRHTGAEALVLVEAGVETLLRGDEPSLGSAAEDLVSLSAAQQLELPLKMLVNLGLGIDRPKGVCHAYTLEAIADLTAAGGFWGSLSLLPHMAEFQSLERAIQTLGTAAWSDAVVAAAHGKCEGIVTPLLSLLWFFELDAVARRCQLTPWLSDKITALDVHRAITNFLTVAQTRPWMDLPI